MLDRRLRVLVINSHPVQYAAPIYRRMAEHPRLDLHVAYCTLRGAEAAHDPEFGATVKWDTPLLDGYSWTEVPNRGSGAEGFFGLFNPGVWKLVRSGDFDAVFCHTGYIRATFWIARFAAKFSRTAFLFGADAVTLRSRDGRVWKRNLKRLLWPLLFRLADQVVVPSSGTRNLMMSLGLPPERVTLTPYAIDNDWWLAESARVDRIAVRSSWGAAADALVILFCAKLQPWKRPFDVLRAFARANPSKGLLVFAGTGPLRSKLETEAEALGIAERVRFLGFVNQSQLPVVYTSADLMVLPSDYEPFAVVVSEAMCCGCPVAVSDRVGAGPDLVNPVHPGLIFRCGDVEALSALLRQADSGKLPLAELGKAARARMESWSPCEHIDATIAAAGIAASRVGRNTATGDESLACAAKSPGPGSARPR